MIGNGLMCLQFILNKFYCTISAYTSLYLCFFVISIPLKLKREYRGFGGNGTFIQFLIYPLLPHTTKTKVYLFRHRVCLFR